MTNPRTDPELVPATLDWDEDQPSSPHFRDIYHSKDAHEEVHRIFLNPCKLSERFERMDTGEFVVGELGFGTGLNCAVICELFLKVSAPDDRLHFISFEKHPVSQQEFQNIAQKRSAMLPVYRAIANVYPPLLGAWHRRTLHKGKITLTLYFGDANTGICELLATGCRPYVNHWLLDGFAPARNPRMWERGLLGNLGKLTAAQGSVATFTSVGQVRRDLISVGFNMRKVSQLPHKRHSLAGQRTAPVNHQQTNSVQRHEVTIVGAGIAGASMAASLAQQNVKVRLVETQKGEHLSGDISPALLHARLLADDSPAALMRSRSYLHAAAWLAANPEFKPTGLLQTLGANTSIEKLQRLYSRYRSSGAWIQFRDAQSASELAGCQMKNPALYFPDSGSVNLGSLRRNLYQHKNITCINDAVSGIKQIAGGWKILGENGKHETQNLILCPGKNVLDFDLLSYLELSESFGQLNTFTHHLDLNLPIIGEGFVCPGTRGEAATIGASYEQSPWPQQKATAYNLDRFRTWWPQISAQHLPAGDSKFEVACRSTRSAAIDRTPIIGAVFDADLQAIPNLWLSCGHGSSGLSSAPLAADIITSQILNTPPPTDLRVVSHCSSLRFRTRQQKRPKRGLVSGHNSPC